VRDQTDVTMLEQELEACMDDCCLAVGPLMWLFHSTTRKFNKEKKISYSYHSQLKITLDITAGDPLILLQY
jgi:hypothetical protein